MIDLAFIPRLYPHNFTMHEDAYLLGSRNGYPPHSVVTLRAWSPRCVPAMLGNALMVFRVDERDLALGESNFAVRWIEWGCHRFVASVATMPGADTPGNPILP